MNSEDRSIELKLIPRVQQLNMLDLDVVTVMQLQLDQIYLYPHK